jgi:hypothetical protein
MVKFMAQNQRNAAGQMLISPTTGLPLASLGVEK